MKLSLKTFLILIVVLLGHALVMAWMGRVFWCQCNSWALWTPDAWSNHTSQHLFDPYSFSHIQHGMIFFIIFSLCRFSPLTALWLSLGLEVSWEILENTPLIINRYRAATASLDYFGDSIMNSEGDLICCLLGFFIAAKNRLRTVVLLYLIIEVSMILTIRDSLLLNIIMLLCPFDAIRQWQVTH